MYTDDTELEERVFDYQFKYILVGDSGSGKSSLLASFLHRTFNPDTPSTIGVQFATTLYKLTTPVTPQSSPEIVQSSYLRKHKSRPSFTGPSLEERTVKLNIYDTAGTERFRAITRQYYRGAVGVILLYDITRRETFENLATWLQDVRNLTAPSSVILLVGTKVDAESARKVSFQEGEEFATEHNLSFIEASSITGENVDQAFTLLTQSVVLGVQTGVFDPKLPNSGVVLGVRRSTSYSLLNEPVTKKSGWGSGCC